MTQCTIKEQTILAAGVNLRISAIGHDRTQIDVVTGSECWTIRFGANGEAQHIVRAVDIPLETGDAG